MPESSGSPRRLMPRRPLLLAGLLTLLLLGVAGTRIVRQVGTEVRRDFLRARRTLGVSPQTGGATDRLWPLSAPVVAYWRYSSDDDRRNFAQAAFERHGSPSWATTLAALLARPGFPRPSRARLDDSAREVTPEYRDSSTPERQMLDLVRVTPPDARQRQAMRGWMATPSHPHRLEAALVFLSHVHSLGDQATTQQADPAFARAVTASQDTDVVAARSLVAEATSTDMQALSSVDDPTLLLVAACAFPDSRFARGCRAYARVRGVPYFQGGDWFGEGYGEARYRTDPKRMKRVAAAAREESLWRAWLKQWPDHPGADDAAYWLVRTLEWQGRRSEALLATARQVAESSGDRDMQACFVQHLLFRLDTGASVEDLAAALHQAPASPLAGAFRYALAVHEARRHHYRRAVELTAGMSPKDAQCATFVGAWGESARGWPARQLEQQRTLWTRATAFEPASTAQQRVALASLWAEPDGFRLGYLVSWAESRGSLLAFATYSADAGVDPVTAAEWRGACSNAQILELVTPVADGRIPCDATTRARARYLQIVALYRQWNDAPIDETQIMHPLPTLPAVVAREDPGWPLARAAERPEDPVDAWYISQAVQCGRALLEEAPHSTYGEDAMMVLAEMTQRREYLQRALDMWPDGRRSDEARTLLEEAY